MKLRVFLVEDSFAMRAHLSDILAVAANMEVVAVAETEAEAKGWLSNNADRWDVALVDLFLREGTGAGVVEHCRDRRPDQRIVVMTNHVRNHALIDYCKLMGANAVYHKATEMDDLVAYCTALAAKSAELLVSSKTV